jgi:mannose-1-phosphate guanylyltransferase
VVARQHRCWWHGQLSSLPARNLILQPENRGTAHGILLPLLHLVEQDPDGTVVLLPADHYVRDEAALALALQEAAALARKNPDQVFLLGVEPDAPDPELGYILPASQPRNGAMSVSRFVEKPALEMARTLLEQGALWNAFIITASIRGLLALYERRFADSLSRMRAAIASDRGDTLQAPAMTELYRRLANADFSRDVLEGRTERLRAVPVRNCGWTDLGTPQRVADALKIGRFGSPGDGAPSSMSLNLAAQHHRLQRAHSECAYLGVVS